MGHLSAKEVENAAPKEKEYKLSDGDGLYLRVRPSGAKSWVFVFRLKKDGRKIHVMTMDSLDDLSLKQAREQLINLRKLVNDEIDPRSARAAMHAENARAISMQKLFEEWIESATAAEKFSDPWIEKHKGRWKLHLEKSLGNILVKDVTRGHLASALDAMSRKKIREETRKALSMLNLMLDYALSRHFIDQNPARMLKPRDFTATANRPRERVLTLIELRQLWLALDEATKKIKGQVGPAMSPITVAAIKLLILTGARRSEVAGMRWNELDLAKGIWLLDSSRTKNRIAHTIYLSELAIQLIKELKKITRGSKFVFGTCQDEEDLPIHYDTLTSAINRLRKGSSFEGVPSFCTHDLRRTAATAWAEYLKVEPHIIERMLNHQPQNKLIATYQRAVYAEEQKTAWLAWGRIVESRVINDSENILILKTAKVLK